MAISPDEGVHAVADAVVRDNDPSEVAWDGSPSVLMTGMMRAYRHTNEQRYLAFVSDWADHHLPHLGDRLARDDDFCGYWGPGFPLLELYETTGQERYGRAAERVIEYLLTHGARLDNGVFGHDSGDLARQIWIDGVYMAVPLLSHGARVFETPEYHREAVRQLNGYASHIQDPHTGLFRHFYDEAGAGSNDSYWGRGNGFMLMSYVELLPHADPEVRQTHRLIRQLGRLLQGLLAHRDDSGLWHTLVDEQETYLETSTAAMTLFGLAEVHRGELLTIPYDDLDSIWDAVATRVDADGRVTGVSGKTQPGESTEHYNEIPQGTYPFGTGAFLMAAAAYAGRT